jgi:aminoglycoside phosphotransferase (APT) family kinase protein
MRLVRRNAAIPVPEIYYFDDARDLCDAPYFFMQKIHGDNLEHVKGDLPPATQEAVERQIGAIIREVNSFGGVYFGYDGNPSLRANTWREAFLKMVDAVLADGARKNADYGYGVDELRAVIARHAPALAEVTTPCLVHWDAWNPNFFVKDGKITGIVDFERALWAEPLMEAQFRRFDGEGITNAMRGYGKTSLTHVEEQRDKLNALHLALTMCTECYYRNYEGDDIFRLAHAWIRTAMGWLQAN